MNSSSFSFLFSLLLVTLIFISQVKSDFVKPNTNLGRFKRVILATRDMCPFDFTIGSVVDTNRTRALKYGVETAATLAVFEAEAFHFIKTTFGLDFLGPTAVFNPANGFRVIPGVGSFIPAIVGDTKTNGRMNFRIVYDSKNKKRNGKWFNVQFSCLFLMSGSGTYSGTMTNATFVPGDILSYNWQFHLKEDANWSKKKNREKFVSFSLNSAQSMNNQWNDPQQLIKVEIRDEKGNAGLFDEIVASYKSNGVSSGSSCRRTRQVITFD